MLARNDAALIIGDAALKADVGALFRYDLATEWCALTGKPFVFAFWGVRESVRLPDAVCLSQIVCLWPGKQRRDCG